MSEYLIDWTGTGESPTIPGKSTITLPEKTLNATSTSLTLTGKGVNNYGEIQQENFIRLMENFASKNPPKNPTIGQLWYNSQENILYVRVDPVTVGGSRPRYFSNSQLAWCQIWPAIDTFAGVREYNAIASTLNRIIGLPSTSGSNAEVAMTKWGWGQTDIVPEYSNVNTMSVVAAGSATCNNEAWVILLSRLRKALRHVGLPESQVSPIGFIDDGRPLNGSTTGALANSYNAYPSPGSQPNYGAGWDGYGPATMQLFYANTIAALTSLIANRFSMATVSSENAKLSGTTRTSNWQTTKVHTFEITFVSQTAAEEYFNAGGYFRFVWSHTPSVNDAINTSWQSFLASKTNLIFDAKGIRHGNVYETATIDVNSTSNGFYDLTTTNTNIFVHDRAYAGAYVTDGGLKIEGRKAATAGGYKVYFDVSFIEALNGAETVQGSTVSEIWGHKPNSSNVNAPVLVQPITTQSGTFTV